MAAHTGQSEQLVEELILCAFSSPEQDHQRGRKRRRSPARVFTVTATQLPSGESATFRGRSRCRSTSRYDFSRNTSRLRGGSLSPSRRKILQIVRMSRQRSQSPSRSRSPNAQESSKRRRQRTRSRSREHREHAHTEHSSLRHEIVIRSENIMCEDKQDG